MYVIDIDRWIFNQIGLNEDSVDWCELINHLPP